MKNILLLTDFSENSMNAIRYALNLFENSFCNFYILNVRSPSVYTSADLMAAGNESISSSIIKKTKHKIMKLIVKLENEFKNKNFSYSAHVAYHEFSNAIVQVQKAKNIDVIVMGTNGVTGAKEVLFGSNTINVIRKVDCTTLVVPEGYIYKLPKEVLLPLDVFDSLSGSAFMGIAKFVNVYSKTLHILRIKPNNEISKEENKDKDINSFLKKTNYKYHKIVNVPMHYAVSCYLQTNTIDLISLLVQKESFFERFFMGSTTTQISNKIQVPLLVFHN
ncbi:universal stress protein [uncultured Polaribacter sp.]|uniref:universal stress protein n=1 Tax=uncultured Polaribacter sp. TaxID=174711 RepID=UPI00262C82FF|nr:universal stress protein [uncultured Polaribacter sp.]